MLIDEFFAIEEIRSVAETAWPLWLFPPKNQRLGKGK